MVRERGWRVIWTERGWRRVQYSEKSFPVFVLMSSLISVMQNNWSEEGKMKAQATKPEQDNNKKKRKHVDFIS